MKIDKIKTSEIVYEDIEKNKNKLLYSKFHNTFIIIKNVTYEEATVTKSKWFSNTQTTTTEYYITDAIILIWNSKEQKWATLNKDGINMFFDTYEGLTKMRNNYIKDIKVPLKSLGVIFNSKAVDE